MVVITISITEAKTIRRVRRLCYTAVVGAEGAANTSSVVNTNLVAITINSTI